MSDQLFWIFAILLIVEILSQILQFDSMGKVFVQFYSLMVHGLVGLTLATFETNQLIYYFLILITVVNGFRYMIHRIDIINERPFLRFTLDGAILGLLMVLMAQIDPFLTFGTVPGLGSEIQGTMLAILGTALLYEMFQRALKTGLHLEEFIPSSILSALIVIGIIVFGFGITLNLFFNLSEVMKYYVMLIFIIGIIVIRLITAWGSREPQKYDILFVLPSFFALLTFIDIAMLGG